MHKRTYRLLLLGAVTAAAIAASAVTQGPTLASSKGDRTFGRESSIAGSRGDTILGRESSIAGSKAEHTFGRESS